LNSFNEISFGLECDDQFGNSSKDAILAPALKPTAPNLMDYFNRSQFPKIVGPMFQSILLPTFHLLDPN
jgi:hypothetical protein